MYDLQEYLEPVNVALLNNNEPYNKKHIGGIIAAYTDDLPDLEGIDIVFAGIAEQRGAGFTSSSEAANTIRKQLYKLFYWHPDVALADIGNIKTGATVADSYAATKTVVTEPLRMGKTVVLLGGSHDNTLAQYSCYKDLNKIIEATVIDSMIDLDHD